MMETKKKILFVINTFSRAGAENALLSLLEPLAADTRYEVELFVLTGQGELVSLLPAGVRLLNRRYCAESVLSKKGEHALTATVMRSLLRRGNGIRLFPYMKNAYREMRANGHVLKDKLLWRAVSDGAERFSTEYDLAVAFLEGGSAYYVADHVRAKKKAAFIHIDYGKAGYTRALDRDCYLQFDRLFPIGEQVKTQFLRVYPEAYGRTVVFPNIVDQAEIRRKAQEDGGFTDHFTGFRLLTVGRLTEQKSYPVAIRAMALLKATGIKVRWYVLGEGPERPKLERLIAQEGLEEDFLLLGAADNPYPYYAQADLYVHATAYEGRSIAIQEAQTLGLAVVASEINAESVANGVDGLLCALSPETVMGAVLTMLKDPGKRKRYGAAGAERRIDCKEQLLLLEELLWTTIKKNC